MVNNAILVQDDITDDMKAKVVMERINTELRDQYDLRNLGRVIDTGEDIHVSRQLVTSRVSGERKVAELEEAEISSQSYADVDESLFKNVVHIVLSQESMLSADANIWNEHVSDAAREIANMENEEVSEVIDSSAVAPGTGDTDWSSTNDPFDDIMSAAQEMREENLTPDTLLMGPGAYANFVSNEEVVKRLERGATADGSITGAAGFRIAQSNSLADSNYCYLLDTNAPAFYVADGPRMVRQYQSDTAFYDGYNIADFLFVGTVWDGYDPDPILAMDTSSSSY